MHITILWTSRDVLTEKFAENFWVQQYWKAIEKFVKSECEEGYSNDLTEFVFGAHFFRRSSFKKYSKKSIETAKNNVNCLFLLFKY